MKQIHTTSSSGMFTRFTITRVLKTSELTNNQLMRAFDTLRVDEIHHMQSLVIVDNIVQKAGGRIKQFNVLKGVLVSEPYFDAQAALNPAVAPFIRKIDTIDDFLLPEDRFNRLLPKTAPVVERLTTTHTVGAGGLVSTGTAFEDPSLVVDPLIVPTLVSGATGEVTFPLINVGDIVNLTYITQALHPTFRIRRQPKNPPISELRIQNETHAVLLNSTLAGLLGITLPAY